MRHIWLLALAAITGCTTVDELRARPISWTAAYPVRFDVMANCLAVRMVEDAGAGLYTVTPQLYQADRRAVITGAAGQRMDAEYSVRQISDTDSEVTFRRSESVFNNEAITAKARARADRCARDP